MLDFSTANIYSEHMARLTSWFRDYSRFYKQSLLYCDFKYPGAMGPEISEAEPLFYNAVTGDNMSFVEGLEIGRKIWNLDNAIWALQGRHRDMVHFADYVYSVPFSGITVPTFRGMSYYMPGIEDGQWQYIKLDGRFIDRDKFENFKTLFYRLEGWDPATGWLKRNTLESQGLGHIADELAKHAKLGSDQAG